jgi:hypothetical protein
VRHRIATRVVIAVAALLLTASIVFALASG